MPWTATDRYDLEPAPGGLAFVQDLLNTIAAGKPREPDLLEDLGDARTWLARALANWSGEARRPAPEVEITAEELQALRDFRHDLRLHLRTAGADASPQSRPAGSLTAVPTALRLDADGRIRAEARGTGWRQVTSLAMIEAYEAQCTDSLRRLKSCRNTRCAVVFFDRSRNNSGVWHDVRTCGNAVNLRNHRARKRATTATT
ncbi:CGNR zinc finger domain-containing protein [Streptomyces fagopyri]|uniref:CGNR zinc finger domain-containing protein n=1 Tax=Streptomyces fagopyri TaxID=2662397 RepID=UPI00371C1A8A